MDLKLDQALQKGIEAYKDGKVQEADRYFKAILRTNPEHPVANHNMGILAVSVGKLEAALPFFKTALEANPSISQFWQSYIDTLTKLDRVADAKAVFDQTLINLYTKGRYKEALTLALKLTNRFPNSVNLYNFIGAANQSLGRLEEAVEAYSKALSLNPDHAEANYNMGNALKKQGKLDEAIEAYNKAVSIKPDYAEVYNNIGSALKEQGKLDEAIEAYNKAVSIKPEYTDAYCLMGNALKKQGKLDEAIEAYNKAVSIKPDYAEVYNNIGSVLQEQGKLEEAIEFYKKTLSIKPDNDVAVQNLMKFPYGTLSEECIDITGDFLKKFSDKVKTTSQLKFLEANYLMHNHKLDLAFNRICQANDEKVFSKEILDVMNANYDIFEKKLRSWILDFVPADSEKLIKIFILAPPRSGKSQLETLLSKSQIIKPLSDSINLQIDFTNCSFEKLFFQNEMYLQKQGFKVVTSTNPHSIFRTLDIAEQIPNSFFIFIKRDKLDVASEIFRSSWKRGHEFGYDSKNIFRLIKFYNEISEIFVKKLVKNSLSISFEDILFQPQKVVSMIEKVCSISCDLQEIDFTKSKIPVSSIFRSQFQTKFLSSQNF